MNEIEGVSIAEKEKTRRAFVWAGSAVLIIMSILWGVYGVIQARYEYESMKDLSVSIGLFTGAVVSFAGAVGDLRDMTAGMEVERVDVSQDGSGVNVVNNKGTQTITGVNNGTESKNNNNPLHTQKADKTGEKRQNSNGTKK